MRKEHKHHVVIILFMMLVILAAFVFVILNGSPSITTSLPHVEVTGNRTQIVSGQATNTSIETEILIGFLIILALLFIWYVAIKIAKELGEHHS